MPRGSDNTRQHRRRTVRILVDYSTEEGLFCDYATTLGAGGMFLETDQPLEVGSPIKVRFRLPHGEELHEIEGHVKWSQSSSRSGVPVRTPGIGIQFHDSVSSAKLARELEDL